MILLVSVVVCTHNRADILKYCLKSLVGQTLDKKFYEVIIIDNGSTDLTNETSSSFINENTNFRYIYESELGLCNARNRGWQEAKGDYIAYIDDDAVAEPSWLFEMVAFIKKFPGVYVFGGPCEGYSLDKIPEWFPPGYSSHDLGDIDRLIEVGKEWIIGCNMVFKKEILEQHGGFLTSFGMMGKKLSYGDEIRVTLDLYESGYNIYYASQMKVKHLIQKDRLTLWWILKYHYSVGKTATKTFKVNYSFFSCCKIIASGFLSFFKELLNPDKMPLRRRLYYSLSGLFYGTGVFVNYFLGD